MTPETWFVVIVIVLPLSLVAFSRWGVDVAALFMIVALGVAQYLGFAVLGKPDSPRDALLAISGFGQPVVVILIGLFILTQTLSNNGVMLWLGQELAALGESSVTRLIFLFSFSAAALSLLMNNVAVGALLLPSAMHVARRSHVRPSKLLIPIAFGTALGGMATYFTTANIVLSNLLPIANPPQPPLHILSFAATGGLIALGGLLYMTLFGRRLLPSRKPGPEQALARRASDELEGLYEVGDRLWEASVDPASPLAGQTLRKCALGEKYGIAVVALRRDYHAFYAPPPDAIIQPRDTILLVGNERRVSQLNDLGVNVRPEMHTITTFGMTLVEFILTPHSAYEGKTIKQLNFRSKYGFTALAVLRGGVSRRTDVGDIVLQPGDSLLVVGPPKRLRDLRADPDIIIFETDPASRPVPRRRALLSVVVFCSAIVLSLFGLPVYLSVLAAALLAVLLGLLSIQDAYRSVEWDVIFFIAGMYAASLAMINTGLASLVGQTVLGLFGNMGPLGLAALTFILAAALTQFMGSQATAFVVGPLAISSAIHFGTNAQAVAVAAAIGCSASFLTPIAHPVNLIMMGPGNYRFGDFFRVGWGLMIVVFLTLMAGMVLFWKL
jgi:di/tricarboxylate transporter